MQFTRRAALVAALIGAGVAWLLASWIAAPGQPAIWHALVLAGGALVGVLDLFVLSLFKGRKG